jgi:prepilin-type N-terminal cleavage/methylation domain-containing protein
MSPSYRLTVPTSHALGRIRGRNIRGFTLIEAIISIVVLSISVPPMFWAVRQAHINRVNPEMISRARWLATEKIESIIADRHSTTRGYAYLVAINYPAESSIPGFPGFTRSVSFTETTVNLSTAGTGYMNVTVTVSWTDATATVRNLAVSTVLTDY